MIKLQFNEETKFLKFLRKFSIAAVQLNVTHRGNTFSATSTVLAQQQRERIEVV